MKLAVPSEILAAVEHVFSCAIERHQRISGGCIHHTYRLSSPEKGDFFLKYNSSEQAPNFGVEAEGLATLHDTHTLRVPRVVTQGNVGRYAYLVMEWVDQGRQGRDYWTFFGEQLARLHKDHSDAQFGLSYDNYIGALPQSNKPMDDWGRFFVSQRIQPMVERAAQMGRFDNRTVQRFERLYERMMGIFPNEPPALLHGDLWGGNILTGLDGHPVMIDPAIYYGHREMELSFMTLFDRQPESFYKAYESVYPSRPTGAHV